MNASLQSKTNNNLLFFEEVFKGINRQEKVELRALQAGKPAITQFISLSDNYYEEIISFTEKYNTEYGIYFGVSTRKSDENGKKENCSSCSALFLDIDTGTDGHKKKPVFLRKQEAFDYINRLNLGQNIIVDSGHGLHLYWLLKEPYDFDTNNFEAFESTLKRLGSVFYADSTHDISRVFRVPGSQNIKCDQLKECNILQLNNEKRYSFDDMKNQIESNPLFQTRIAEIKSIDLIRNIFGFIDEEFQSRSEADQSIISKLLKMKFNAEDIKAIFDNFPTTGKYLERKATDPKGAESYLMHSVESAKTFQLNSSKKVESEELKIFTTTASYKEDVTVKTVTKKSKKACINDNNQTDLYFINYEEDRFGYYKSDFSSEPAQPMRLSNFVIKFDKQISMKIDRNPITVFNGSLVLSNTEAVAFDNMAATLLGSSQKLKEYLLSLAGVKVQFFGNGTALCEAIKHTNCDIQEETALEFGYNENHTEYVTPDYIITADNIIEKTTPIMFSENWKDNKLGFRQAIKAPFESLVNDIIDKLFVWDDPQVTLLGLAYTLLPIIYPSISASANGKPFLMFQGTTGCGKTTLSRWLQHFYGDFNTLTSWTSTSTSLNIIGNSFKDTMIVLDDFKKANFYNEGDIRKAMLLLQNYYDGHARSRANVDLKVRDDKPFKGFILLSAEDIVITQPSTLARGIVIPVAKKAINYEMLNEIDSLSKSFSHFTLQYLQYILGLKSSEDFESVLLQNKTVLNNYVQDNNLSGDNLPRITNNFAIIKTSWDYVFRFLKSVSVHPLLDSHNDCVEIGIKSLLMENFKRTQTLNPEELYENALWEMISNEILTLQDVNIKKISLASEEKTIGYYKTGDGEPFKMILKFTESFRKIETYLRDQGGLGTSSNTLKTKLAQLGKIKFPSTGRVELGGNFKQMRGVYWTGNIPVEIMDKLGLRQDSPTQINDNLLFDNNYKDEDFIIS